MSRRRIALPLTLCLALGAVGGCTGPSMQEIADKWVGADRSEVTATLGEPLKVIEPTTEGGLTVYRYASEGTITHGPMTTISPAMTTGRVVAPTGEGFNYTAMGTQTTTTAAWQEPVRCTLDLYFDARWKVSKAVGGGC